LLFTHRTYLNPCSSFLYHFILSMQRFKQIVGGPVLAGK
jgi:hypothetical protein